jgi:hypothetical protein
MLVARAAGLRASAASRFALAIVAYVGGVLVAAANYVVAVAVAFVGGIGSTLAAWQSAKDVIILGFVLWGVSFAVLYLQPAVSGSIRPVYDDSVAFLSSGISFVISVVRVLYVAYATLNNAVFGALRPLLQLAAQFARDILGDVNVAGAVNSLGAALTNVINQIATELQGHTALYSSLITFLAKLLALTLRFWDLLTSLVLGFLGGGYAPFLVRLPRFLFDFANLFFGGFVNIVVAIAQQIFYASTFIQGVVQVFWAVYECFHCFGVCVCDLVGVFFGFVCPPQVPGQYGPVSEPGNPFQDYRCPPPGPFRPMDPPHPTTGPSVVRPDPRPPDFGDDADVGTGWGQTTHAAPHSGGPRWDPNWPATAEGLEWARKLQADREALRRSWDNTPDVPPAARWALWASQPGAASEALRRQGPGGCTQVVAEMNRTALAVFYDARYPPAVRRQAVSPMELAVANACLFVGNLAFHVANATGGALDANALLGHPEGAVKHAMLHASHGVKGALAVLGQQLADATAPLQPGEEDPLAGETPFAEVARLLGGRARVSSLQAAGEGALIGSGAHPVVRGFVRWYAGEVATIVKRATEEYEEAAARCDDSLAGVLNATVPQKMRALLDEWDAFKGNATLLYDIVAPVASKAAADHGLAAAWANATDAVWGAMVRKRPDAALALRDAWRMVVGQAPAWMEAAAIVREGAEVVAAGIQPDPFANPPHDEVPEPETPLLGRARPSMRRLLVAPPTGTSTAGLGEWFIQAAFDTLDWLEMAASTLLGIPHAAAAVIAALPPPLDAINPRASFFVKVGIDVWTFVTNTELYMDGTPTECPAAGPAQVTFLANFKPGLLYYMTLGWPLTLISIFGPLGTGASASLGVLIPLIAAPFGVSLCRVNCQPSGALAWSPYCLPLLPVGALDFVVPLAPGGFLHPAWPPQLFPANPTDVAASCRADFDFRDFVSNAVYEMETRTNGAWTNALRTSPTLAFLRTWFPEWQRRLDRFNYQGSPHDPVDDWCNAITSLNWTLLLLIVAILGPLAVYLLVPIFTASVVFLFQLFAIPLPAIFLLSSNLETAAAFEAVAQELAQRAAPALKVGERVAASRAVGGRASEGHAPARHLRRAMLAFAAFWLLAGGALTLAIALLVPSLLPLAFAVWRPALALGLLAGGAALLACWLADAATRDERPGVWRDLLAFAWAAAFLHVGAQLSLALWALWARHNALLALGLYRPLFRWLDFLAAALALSWLYQWARRRAARRAIAARGPGRPRDA